MLLALIFEQTCTSQSVSYISCSFRALTSGLEQTIIPTSGSRLPEVTPLKFLKTISSMASLLCMGYVLVSLWQAKTSDSDAIKVE